MTRREKNRTSDSGLVVACGLSWILAGLLPAWYFFRFFYADGAYFFLKILEHRTFHVPEQGRAATYLLTQWPVVVATLAGLTDIRWLSWCYGAGLMLTPACLHGLAIGLLLRRGLTSQSAVYLLMLWLLTGFSGLCIVTDSHTPTALFLLAAVLVTSVVFEKPGSWLAPAAIGVLSFSLYEFWAFYSAGLLVLLAVRFGPRWAGMPPRARLSCLGTMGIFAASVVIQTWRLLRSSGNPNQASLLQMLHGTTYPVYLVLITGWFVVVSLHFWLEARLLGWPLPGIHLSARARHRILISSFSLLALLAAIQHQTMIRYSYPFRTLNLILPLVYAGWLALVARKGDTVPAPAGWRGLLVVVTIWLLVNETWMTIGWREYQAWSGDITRAGAESIYIAQPPATRTARAWIYPWSHSAQSFLAQAVRSGRVKGLGYDPGAKWNPYGPGHEDLVGTIAKRHGIRLDR